MQRVAIVDYGLCNLDSVRRALEEVGARAFVTDVPSDLDGADRIVLPGVGAFPDAMHNLREHGLDDALTKLVIAEGVPFLGVCLGMQLVAALGTEGGERQGLGWIDARVERFVPPTADIRVPHVGWNEVLPDRSCVLFDGIPDGADFYFVHSFHVECADEGDVVASTPYCGGFTSVVGHDRVFGVQFHPEKSQRNGLQLLRNFLAA